jgi:hypothetical protein
MLMTSILTQILMPGPHSVASYDTQGDADQRPILLTQESAKGSQETCTYGKDSVWWKNTQQQIVQDRAHAGPGEILLAAASTSTALSYGNIVGIN